MTLLPGAGTEVAFALFAQIHNNDFHHRRSFFVTCHVNQQHWRARAGRVACVLGFFRHLGPPDLVLPVATQPMGLSA